MFRCGAARDNLTRRVRREADSGTADPGQVRRKFVEGSRDRRYGSRVFYCPSDRFLELRRSGEFGVPEQEQSGAETLFSRQLGSDGFSVNTDVPEEEKEEARGVNKTSAGALLTV